MAHTLSCSWHLPPHLSYLAGSHRARGDAEIHLARSQLSASSPTEKDVDDHLENGTTGMRQGVEWMGLPMASPAEGGGNNIRMGEGAMPLTKNGWAGSKRKAI